MTELILVKVMFVVMIASLVLIIAFGIGGGKP